MKTFFTGVLFILVSFSTFPQTIDHHYFERNREVYFKFEEPSKENLNNLSSVISIDNVSGNTVFAYANEKEYRNFLKFGIPLTILSHPGPTKQVAMNNSPKNIQTWDTYPTYTAYVAMMNQFQTAHPDICKIIDAGTTVKGRKLLFAKITQNVNVHGTKPQFMYSSSMHGNETTGYVLMLRLIDTLLNSYGTDTRLTNMIDSTEIWVNPLFNPDGTYHGGDSTVTGATRYNGNSIDLNRNFPDPADGQHPDGNDWQPETIALMNLESANNFSLSANLHDGTEVVNYPWDTWAKLNPDNTWFQFISRKFADTVHAHSVPGYFTDLGNGITNGYAWYRVAGGRQDYMTYFRRGREVTIELSYLNVMPASELPVYWNYLSHSLLNYIDNTKYGIRGTVKDIHGNPVKALIKLNGSDFDNSAIYSDSLTGGYYRMTVPGTYTVTFSADSFVTQTINNITVSNYNATILNIQLHPVNTLSVELTYFNIVVNDNNVMLSWETTAEGNNLGFEIVRKSMADNKSIVIGFVEGNGNSTMKHDYVFTDKVTMAGKYEYLLLKQDSSGALLTIAKSETEIYPNNYSLYQNYPNPFNLSTVIDFEVPREDHITIKLYDILGKEVKTLLNETKLAGHYSLIFNAGDLPSGMYIYKMQSGNYFSAKKLMITK
jgi:hypothetical protein